MTDETFDRVQKALDVFSQNPGAIIIRDATGWRALEVGKIGQVLAVGVDLLPGWYYIDELPS